MWAAAIVGLLATTAVSAYDCPDYALIRQPNVDSALFDVCALEGVWYMIATNEPTLPSFCTCGVNTYEVHANEGWYAYHNVDTCVGAANISVPIKGELSDDPEAPGDLRENFGPFNHTANKLDPNMVFEAGYEASGELSLVLTYACISARLFSFNVMSRTNRWASADIEAIVATANATTGGVLRVDGMRFADQSVYQQCGML